MLGNSAVLPDVVTPKNTELLHAEITKRLAAGKFNVPDLVKWAKPKLKVPIDQTRVAVNRIVNDLFQRDQNSILSLAKKLIDDHKNLCNVEFFKSNEFVALGVYYKVGLSEVVGNPDLLLDYKQEADILGGEVVTALTSIDSYSVTIAQVFIWEVHDAEIDDVIMGVQDYFAKYGPGPLRIDRNRNYLDGSKRMGMNEKWLDVFEVVADTTTFVPSATSLKMMEGIENQAACTKTNVVQWFLNGLKLRGWNPDFVAADVIEFTQQALVQVFPKAELMVSSWHVGKLLDGFFAQPEKKRNMNSNTYFKKSPSSSEIDDPCWSDMDGSFCSCTSTKCGSSVLLFGHEKLPNEEQRAELEKMIFLQTLNIPSSASGYDGNVDLTALHESYIKHIFHWCMKRSLFSTWVYLWLNWYHSEKRQLWMYNGQPKCTVNPPFFTRYSEYIGHSEFLNLLNSDLRIDTIFVSVIFQWIPKEILRVATLLHENRDMVYVKVEPRIRDVIFKAMSSLAQTSYQITEDTDKFRKEVVRYKTNPYYFVCHCQQYFFSELNCCAHILAFYDEKTFASGGEFSRLKHIFLTSAIRVAKQPFWRCPSVVLMPSCNVEILPVDQTAIYGLIPAHMPVYPVRRNYDIARIASALKVTWDSKRNQPVVGEIFNTVLPVIGPPLKAKRV